MSSDLDTLLNRLFDACQENDLQLWQDHVHPDAKVSWNTAVMDGNGLVDAIKVAHEKYQDIQFNSRSITTVEEHMSKAMSFVAFDWKATVQSNNNLIEVPCQVRIHWDGNQIVEYHEVFDGTVVTKAMEDNL